MQHLQEILQLIDGYIGGAQWFAFFLLGTGSLFHHLFEIPPGQVFQARTQLCQRRL